MILENPSSNFISLATSICFFLATLSGVLARSKKTHLLTWLSCVLFLGVGISYLYLAMTSYTGLELSKKEDNKSTIEARFALFRAPILIQQYQLKTIYVKQEWTQRKLGPENWYEIVVESNDGTRFIPNWSISAKTKDEYEKLALFVQEMQNRNLPLQFSYKDKNGKLHETQSLTERPE